MSAVAYRETIYSAAYPGNRHTSQCLQPAVEQAEIALDLSAEQRQRTVWRLDGGCGSDAHVRWLVQRGYQVVAKGMNHRRAQALARRVPRWDAYRPGVWLGEVAAPVDYGRPVQVVVKRQLKQGVYRYSYLVSTLGLSSKRQVAARYDARGGAEVEQFRNDKSGLGLQARRKHSFLGQFAYILLTDLAHNLLADFYFRALVNSPFAAYGPKRMVRDLLATPGRLVFEGQRLVRVELLSQKQLSADLVQCLRTYCAGL